MSKPPTGFSDVPDPFGEMDLGVEEYQPPAVSAAAWEREQPPAAAAQPAFNLVEDDEPFTAAHLAAASQDAVPAIVPAAGAPLPFTASVAPSADVSGRMGPSVPAVTRIGAAPDHATLLIPPGAPSSAPVSTGPSTGPPAPVEDPSSFPFYNIKRYRTYFNVDTDEVLQRIFRSVAFFFKGDFFDHIEGNPDLYGPWWIASTLVFVSAAAGNLASYIAFRHAGSGSPAPSGEYAPGWYYDVDKVGGSMGLFYGYVGIVGLALYLVLRWFKAGVGLAQVWCAYGYALAAYIPMAALCVLPMEAARWSLVGVATAISGTFLVLNFKDTVVEAAGARAVPVLLVMAVLHAGLGLALKLYFFHYSNAV